MDNGDQGLNRVTNARGAVVTKSRFDIRSREFCRIDADSGERWQLRDCLNWLMLTLDARDMRQHFSCDSVGRLEGQWLKEGPHAILISKMVFGENIPNVSRYNLRANLYQMYDQAGMAQNSLFDFKGNCVESKIRLAEDYKSLLDWAGIRPQLEAAVFESTAEFNARNQAHKTTAPDDSSTIRTYHIREDLQTLSFQHSAALKLSPVFISGIVVALHGRREQVQYGNSVLKLDMFDPATRLLERSQIKRTASPKRTLRDVGYTYDCCERLTNTKDSAAQDVYFRNNVIKPIQDFTYDAAGQIIKAFRREQMSISNGKKSFRPYSPADSSTRLPGDGNRMCQYTETYCYDSVGNILAVYGR